MATFRSSPGAGQLFLSAADNSPAQFTHLSGTYPLKLLAPTPLPSQPSNLRVCYMLAYGGGLVAGDTISLQVRVGRGSRLLLLTQGSTKVFKNRMGIRPLAHGSAERTANGTAPPVTKQRLIVHLAPGSLLLLLPDPIQPFKSSSYIQSQRFVLPPIGTPASVLVLDWFTSGRNAGKRFQEEWEFGLYSSVNEVVYASQRERHADEQGGGSRSMAPGDGTEYTTLPSTVPIMREKVTLRADEQPNDTPSKEAPASQPPDAHSLLPGNLQSRMRPYQIYATLLIHGPLLAPLVHHLSARANAPTETQFQASRPAPLIWSFSKIARTQAGSGQGAVAGPGECEGGILRVAGMETEVVKEWIGEVLASGGVSELVGEALWARVF